MTLLDDVIGVVNPAALAGKVLGPLLNKLIGLIPDPQKRAEMELEISKLQQSTEFKQLDADLQVALAQAQINLEEAKSSDRFKSWWRPAAGWCCVLGLLGQFLVGPTLTWFMALIGHPTPFPQLDTPLLTTLLLGLLGLGTLRTVDKVRGVA